MVRVKSRRTSLVKLVTGRDGVTTESNTQKSLGLESPKQLGCKLGLYKLHRAMSAAILERRKVKAHVGSLLANPQFRRLRQSCWRPTGRGQEGQAREQRNNQAS